MPPAFRISWPLVPGLENRLLAPEGKLAVSKKGRGVHATGQRVLEKSYSNVEQKHLYGEKWPFDSSGLGSQTGTVVCPEDSLWPLTLSPSAT